MRISKTIIWTPTKNLVLPLLRYEGRMVNATILFSIYAAFEDKRGAYYLQWNMNSKIIFKNTISELKEIAQEQIESLAQQIVFTKIQKQLKTQ